MMDIMDIHGYLSPHLDMYGYGYHGYPSGYQTWISLLDSHVHSWISTWIPNFAINAIGYQNILVDIQSGYHR